MQLLRWLRDNTGNTLGIILDKMCSTHVHADYDFYYIMRLMFIPKGTAIWIETAFLILVGWKEGNQSSLWPETGEFPEMQNFQC